MNRDKLINFINEYLKSSEIKDYSKNGLQVEGKERVNKILFSVSISLELIKKAIEEKADMIIVHHGLFWGKEKTITGVYKEKLKLLIENEINLCAWHLPLDIHPIVGNNISLIKLFKVKDVKPFGLYEGIKIGYKAKLIEKMDIKNISKVFTEKINSNPILFNYGPSLIKTIGIVSGGAQKIFEQAIEEKLDLFITGEVSEPNYEMARENKTNFMSLGHYNSEKIGLWSLEKIIRSKFNIKTSFFDTKNPI